MPNKSGMPDKNKIDEHKHRERALARKLKSLRQTETQDERPRETGQEPPTPVLSRTARLRVLTMQRVSALMVRHRLERQTTLHDGLKRSHASAG